jgi:hypothetical protein
MGTGMRRQVVGLTDEVDRLKRVLDGRGHGPEEDLYGIVAVEVGETLVGSERLEEAVELGETR